VTATVPRSPSGLKQEADIGGSVSKMKMAIFTDGMFALGAATLVLASKQAAYLIG
jgi:hypothetical protein